MNNLEQILRESIISKLLESINIDDVMKKYRKIKKKSLKEETLDELSRETLSSYLGKAKKNSKAKEDYVYNLLNRKTSGYTQTSVDKGINQMNANSILKDKEKRDKNIELALKKVKTAKNRPVKENPQLLFAFENNNLNEISQNVLQSYAQKAKKNSNFLKHSINKNKEKIDNLNSFKPDFYSKANDLINKRKKLELKKKNRDNGLQLVKKKMNEDVIDHIINKETMPEIYSRLIKRMKLSQNFDDAFNKIKSPAMETELF